MAVILTARGVCTFAAARILLPAMLSSGSATAADPCPATRPGVEWAASCFESVDGGRRVKPQYLKRLRLDRHGHTTIMIGGPWELVAVNRQGKVVVPGIRHTGDFDFPDAEAGIARFDTTLRTPGSKARRQCGYFDSRTFRILIPAEYAQCKPFAKGEAIACKDCVSLCTEPECQNSILVDGEGVALGPDGSVRRRFKLPDRNQACAAPGSEESKAYSGNPPECIRKGYNPFK